MGQKVHNTTIYPNRYMSYDDSKISLTFQCDLLDGARQATVNTMTVLSMKDGDFLRMDVVELTDVEIDCMISSLKSMRKIARLYEALKYIRYNKKILISAFRRGDGVEFPKTVVGWAARIFANVEFQYENNAEDQSAIQTQRIVINNIGNSFYMDGVFRTVAEENYKVFMKGVTLLKSLQSEGMIEYGEDKK